MEPPFYIKHDDPDDPAIKAGKRWAFRGPFVTMGQAQAVEKRMLFNRWDFYTEIVPLAVKRELEGEIKVAEEDIHYFDPYISQKEAESEAPDPSIYTYAELKALNITPEQAQEMLQLEIDGKDRWAVKQYLRKRAKQ